MGALDWNDAGVLPGYWHQPRRHGVDDGESKKTSP